MGGYCGVDYNEAPSEMITEQFALAEPYEVVETDYMKSFTFFKSW